MTRMSTPGKPNATRCVTHEQNKVAVPAMPCALRKARSLSPPLRRRANRNTCRSSETTGCTWCVRMHLRVRHNGPLINLARGKAEALWRARGDLSHAAPREPRPGGRARERGGSPSFPRCFTRGIDARRNDVLSPRSFSRSAHDRSNDAARVHPRIGMFTFGLYGAKTTRLLTGGQ